MLLKLLLPANGTVGGIRSATRLSTMRSRPESCGKDSHETPCSIDGECLCCFSPEWLLCSAVEPVWSLWRRLCYWRLRSRWMSSGSRLQPGSWHDSDRLSSTGTSRHVTIPAAAGCVSADDAADHRDGLAADLSLRNLAINANRRPLHSEMSKAAGRYVISCRLLCCAGGSLAVAAMNFETFAE
jgi:hypothetical protein